MKPVAICLISPGGPASPGGPRYAVAAATLAGAGAPGYALPRLS